ncbi:LysM peptidoglycan-binding domain-containing protein [Candidatus Peribacteria bacterium]|nr:LysM peptidoglycan-binding domain-containing protein [Candidatus Peribacteria bacterium]
MQNYTGVVVRGEYDRSTILASYDWETGESTSDFIQNLVDTPPETTLIAPVPSPVVENPTPTSETPVNRTPPADPKRALYVTHTVVKGDTISTIAQKYNIPIATLRTMNSLDSDILSINQKIVIPRINGVQYAIQRGDTLSTIAQKYGIKDINTILVANDMSRNSTLSVGRQLLLPNPTKDPTKKVATQPTAPSPAAKTATKTPVATATSAQPVAKKPAEKPVVIQTPKDPQNITYGDYSLSLKVSKGCRGFVW